MANDHAPRTSRDASRALIGHASEYQRLVTVLDAQPGVLVLAADPLSGASAVVRLALGKLGTPAVYVDARAASDEMDLAMAVADAAVGALRPPASAWWAGTAPPGDLEGLRLHRALGRHDVYVDDLRLGSGPGARALDVALELTVELTGGPVVVALDHLDGVAAKSRSADGDPLATLRAAHQRLPDLQLLLVGRSAGPVEQALSDHEHPLFQGGQLERLRRADSSRFVADLSVARPWTDAPVSTIRIAAEIAAGAPAYVWSVVDLAEGASDDEPARTMAAWRTLRTMTEAHTTGQYDLLRAVHPVAQPVVAAVAAGLGAYSLPINDGRVRAALQSLRAVGVVWQPRRRDWAVADPLLAAWTRDHAPPWVRRRARAATGGPR